MYTKNKTNDFSSYKNLKKKTLENHQEMKTQKNELLTKKFLKCTENR